ncbi:MAG: hypothetical protein HFJ06_01830 [Lachnospiraceae bacterium]|nr:hypothetical protein [Lachnospiraceae bacterium]
MYSKIFGFVAFAIGCYCVIISLLLYETENSGMDGNVDTSIYIMVAIVTFAVAAVSFIVMIVNDIRIHKQDTYRFDGLDKGSDRLSAGHDRLSSEHDRLSSEHEKLGRDLSEKIHDIGMRQEVLKDKVFDYISREDGRKEKMAAILPEQEVLSQIQLLYDKILSLKDENTKLKYQNQKLQKELSRRHKKDLEENQEMYKSEQMTGFEDFIIDEIDSMDGWER